MSSGNDGMTAPRLRLGLRKRLALELYKNRRDTLIAAHPLRTLFWECTQRCNIACKHCGSDCKISTHIADMPAEDFLKAVDSITPHVDPHKVLVVITGGEPLMRNDLESIGLALYRRGYPWGIVTNGLALSETRFMSLRKAGIHSITASIDGLEEDHNWLRGHRDAFSRATAACRMIAAATDLHSDAVTCVNNRNIATLGELKEKLIEAGMRAWRLFTIFPAGRAASHPKFQLSATDYRRLLDFIKETRAEGRIHASYCCEGFLGEYEGDVRDSFFGCNAGISVGSILINGDISACPSIRSNYAQGNIYRDDFMTVWNNRFEPYRNRAWMRELDPCSHCKAFRYCRGGAMHLRESDGTLMRCNLLDLQK